MLGTSRRFVGYNLVLLGFGVVALFVIVATSVLYSRRTQTYAADALKAARMDRLLLKYQGDLLDAETAVRGFQLTQRETYLDPYKQALKEVDEDAQALRSTLDSFVEKTIGAAEIEDLIRLGSSTLEAVRTNLEEARAGKLDPQALQLASDRGKATMDAVRAKVDVLQDAADAVRRRQAGNMRAAAATLTLLIALGVGMIVILAISAGLFIVRHLRELDRAREALVEANANLEERVRTRTQGVMRANEELQRYAYIVSHDLRAPLVNIMGFVSELETATGMLKSHIEETRPDRDDPAAPAAR